jgi:anti-sigma regulatory factor (Ser/Thr protein kinase)/CheY-like chemotaxis protein
MARLLVIQHNPAVDAVLSTLPGLDGLDVERTTSNAEALQLLERRPFDALLTSPSQSLEADIAFLERARAFRPGIRAVCLAVSATPDAVVAALRAEVFAVFTEPFDAGEIAELVQRAARADAWADDIHVIAAVPHWITLRVRAKLVTAERVVSFMDQLHRRLFTGKERDDLIAAFREILLNAIEHGAGFDPDKDIRVDAIRTKRALTFYFRDPGPGFRPDHLPYAATDGDPISHIERREEAGIRPGGFGVLLTRQLVDEIVYHQTGSEVLLVKYLE